MTSAGRFLEPCEAGRPAPGIEGESGGHREARARINLHAPSGPVDEDRTNPPASRHPAFGAEFGEDAGTPGEIQQDHDRVTSRADGEHISYAVNHVHEVAPQSELTLHRAGEAANLLEMCPTGSKGLHSCNCPRQDPRDQELCTQVSRVTNFQLRCRLRQTTEILAGEGSRPLADETHVRAHHH